MTEHQTWWDSAHERDYHEPEDARRRRRSAAIGGIVGSAIGMIAAALHPYWLPLCAGVVTDQWPRLLWSIYLGGAITIAGDALWLGGAWRLLRAVGSAVAAGGTLLTSIAVYAIYPFDVTAFGGRWL